MRVFIDVHPLVESDIDEAVYWYEVQKEGLGYEFYLSFIAAYNLIANYPQLYQKIYKNYRRAMFD